jgi:hypothetical protein
VGPVPGSGLVPGDIRFFAEGSRVRVIRHTIMHAHLCAPNATVYLSMGTTLKGRFVGRVVRARRIHAQLSVGTSTVTTTTTSSTTTIPSCGNGHVEAGEECDPPGSLTCGAGSALGAFLESSPIGVFLECLADCTCPTTTTSTTVPTTTTTSTTSTTSTTVPGDTCGNGVVDEGEQCDPAAAPSCGTGLACGAAGTAGACTCVPPGGSKVEVCGNCADDDGNGLTDFEDPACCARAQTVGLILRRGRIKTLGAGASRLKLRTKAVSGLASVNPLAQDVFVQIRPADGTDILCAQIPASTFRKKRGVFKFRDRSHLVASARGLERVTIRVKRNGSARLRAAGRSVQMAAPPPGRLQVTLGFRNAAEGDAQNRCSKTTATFRGVRRGLKAP